MTRLAIPTVQIDSERSQFATIARLCESRTNPGIAVYCDSVHTSTRMPKDSFNATASNGKVRSKRGVLVDDGPAFVVTANGTCTKFYIDDDAFAGWVADDSDEWEAKLLDPSNDSVGSSLSDLAYEALSAGVLVGDPSLELNVHSDGVGYLVRLNNVAGRQRSVGLTRGLHQLLWPLNELPACASIRRYLQQVCDVANALLNDLLVAAV